MLSRRLTPTTTTISGSSRRKAMKLRAIASLLVYTSDVLASPISQSVRIQLPLKTQYAVNAPCPSSANAKMMSEKNQDDEKASHVDH